MTYSGTMIRDLQEIVAKYPRISSVDGTVGWRILAEARLHLCGGGKEWPPKEMTAGDVQAWNLMADLQDADMKAPSTYCLAELAQNCEDAYPEICGRKTVEGSDFCREHLENL